MKIGIIVAMGAELTGVIAEMEQSEIVEANGYTFHVGKMGTNSVVVMQCGIGKVNAAMGTMALIERFAPDVVINSGVAGSTGRGAEVLDIMVATEVAYHDVWCGQPNERGQVQGCPARFYADEKMLQLPWLQQSAHIKRGLLASGDYFIQTAEELGRVMSVLPEAMAVDMESGAIAQVCYKKGVPFVVIRVISDKAGSENHTEQYLDFWTVAPQRSFSLLRQLLHSDLKR